MRLLTSRVLIALPLLLAACSTDTTPLAPTVSAEAAPFSAAPQALSFETLLACPTSNAVSARATIGKDGGILTAGGHALYVPRGAVSKKTTFVLRAPASSYLELDITAEGYDHFVFNSQVAVRVNYARCPDSVLPKSALFAWWIDTGSKQRLQEMQSWDDREHKALTFGTDHLSGYAIAYRGERGGEPR